MTLILVVNRVLGRLLLAIGVQFIITSIEAAFLLNSMPAGAMSNYAEAIKER